MAASWPVLVWRPYHTETHTQTNTSLKSGSDNNLSSNTRKSFSLSHPQTIPSISNNNTLKQRLGGASVQLMFQKIELAFFCFKSWVKKEIVRTPRSLVGGRNCRKNQAKGEREGRRGSRLVAAAHPSWHMGKVIYTKTEFLLPLFYIFSSRYLIASSRPPKSPRKTLKFINGLLNCFSSRHFRITIWSNQRVSHPPPCIQPSLPPPSSTSCPSLCNDYFNTFKRRNQKKEGLLIGKV